MKLSKIIVTSILIALATLSSPSRAAVTVGQAAPQFTLPLLGASGAYQLSQFQGKVLYVDFWASWCGPCRQSLPLLNELRQELGAQGFEVLAINLDENPQDGLAFLQQYPVSYPVVSDPQAETPKIYGLKAMPTSYLLDKQGNIRVVHAGFKEGDIVKIRSQVMQLLGEN